MFVSFTYFVKFQIFFSILAQQLMNSDLREVDYISSPNMRVDDVVGSASHPITVDELPDDLTGLSDLLNVDQSVGEKSA